MSKLSDDVYANLKKLFPYYNIIEEYYVKYKNVRLFFDFFIKDLNIVIEVQGDQHYKFVKHFHGDIHGFIESKQRDNLKKEYCENNEIILVEIDSSFDLKTLKDFILRKLEKTTNGRDNNRQK